MFKRKKEIPTGSETVTIDVTVVGQHYHQKEIESFAKKNPLYKKNSPTDGSWVYEKIYKEAKPELIPEKKKGLCPIQVVYGGKLIGYVANEQLEEIHRILSGPHTLEGRIFGGNLKFYNEHSGEWIQSAHNVNIEYKLTYPV